MKKFKFRLETVLKYRRFLEEKKKKEFAIVLGKLNEAKNTMNLLKSKLNNTLLSIKREQTIKNLNIINIMLYESYLIQIKKLIEWKLIEISQIEEKLNKKREEFIEASKDRKIMDKLKEKNYFEYMYNLDKKLQSVLDEVAVIKFYKENYKNNKEKMAK